MESSAVAVFIVGGVSLLFLLGCVGVLLLIRRTTSQELRAVQILLGERSEDDQVHAPPVAQSG